jgi:histidine triad (HIT) family protein
MDNCLFCKIAEGQIPAQIVYRDAECVAFRDINPQAPTHILVIPRRHISTTNDLQPEDRALVGHLTLAAAQIARQEGIEEDGYRLVMNCNEGAGQSVFHIHLHLLGGRGFGWPPG